jgi:hypothetical protein
MELQTGQLGTARAADWTPSEANEAPTSSTSAGIFAKRDHSEPNAELKRTP